MNTALANTPLHAWHVEHGGRMVDFAGWSMPVQYTTITAEHHATRRNAGMFDVSHMGRIRFSGPDAAPFLDRLVTRRVADLAPNQIRYALVCNDAGGILDDVLVYRLAEPASFQMVVNASNREKILQWIGEQRGSLDVAWQDDTCRTAMIAVQGPRAVEIVNPLMDRDLAAMKYYHSQAASFDGRAVLVSRTGYTGEDGCELIIDADEAPWLWDTIYAAGASLGLAAAGLGCRDTLRLEAAMPLYGHELSEEINPLQAGLDFAVTLAGRTFVGCEAIARSKEAGRLPRRIGLSLSGRRVPREGYDIQAGDLRVGKVTSGTFSPTLDMPIAMGYVDPDYATAATELAVDVRGRLIPATVVPLPFYKR